MGGVRPEPRAWKAGAGAGRRPEPDAPRGPWSARCHGGARSSPRAMSATRSRAIRTPLLAPLQKQPFPPTRIGHSRHHTPANRATAFSPIRPPPADLRSIRADRGLSEGAGRGRQHGRGAEHVQGIGHKAQLRRHSEAVPPRQAHGGGALEGRRLREPDGALPFRSTGPAGRAFRIVRGILPESAAFCRGSHHAARESADGRKRFSSGRGSRFGWLPP